MSADYGNGKSVMHLTHADDVTVALQVDGDRDTYEVFYDLATLFDNVFYPKGNAPRKSTLDATYYNLQIKICCLLGFAYTCI